MDFLLHLSQDLVINNRYTISIPGETEHYFGSCNVDGSNSTIYQITGEERWYALTDKASEVWTGEISKALDDTLLGKLKE